MENFNERQKGYIPPKNSTKIGFSFSKFPRKEKKRIKNKIKELSRVDFFTLNSYLWYEQSLKNPKLHQQKINQIIYNEQYN